MVLAFVLAVIISFVLGSVFGHKLQASAVKEAKYFEDLAKSELNKVKSELNILKAKI